MKQFYQKVTSRPKLILISFGILFLLCLACKSFISVNYDMNDYLPSDSASTIALDTMEREYEGGIPNARIMIENVSVAEALQYLSLIHIYHPHGGGLGTNGGVEEVDGVIRYAVDQVKCRQKQQGYDDNPVN